jgi:uncharacterized protein YkwD
MGQELRTRNVSRYGWRAPLPRLTHHPRYTSILRATDLPSRVDLRPQDGPILDQSDLGSCVFNAIAGVGQFVMSKAGAASYVASRLFGYYLGRQLEGTISSDSGISIADGMTVAATDGLPPETDWPYDISRFAQKPPQIAYADGLKHLATQVMSLDNTSLITLKSSLAQGWPFVAGATLYESFESDQVARTGQVPMPGPGEQIAGGHAFVVLGYDDSTGLFLCRNSWGTGWGMSGYFTISYSYLTNSNLADDFHIFHLVSGLTPVPSPSPDFAATLLSLHNQVRQQAEVPVLTLQPQLSSAAKWEAQDCAARDVLSHTGSDGSQVGDRVTRAGYAWGTVAENLDQQPQPPATWSGPDPRTPQAAMTAWEASPGHLANIESPQVSQVGFGMADSVTGSRYWCAVFGQPQGGPSPPPPPTPPVKYPLLTVGGGNFATAAIVTAGQPATFQIQGPKSGRVQLFIYFTADFATPPVVSIHNVGGVVYPIAMHGPVGTIPSFPGGPFLLDVRHPDKTKTSIVRAFAVYF